MGTVGEIFVLTKFSLKIEKLFREVAVNIGGELVAERCS